MNLATTSQTGHLPNQLFVRLSDWCVNGDLSESGHHLAGFYAHLECDTNDSCRELRLLLDGQISLLLFPRHLTGGNLAKAVKAGWTEAHTQGVQISDEQHLTGSV